MNVRSVLMFLLVMHSASGMDWVKKLSSQNASSRNASSSRESKLLRDVRHGFPQEHYESCCSCLLRALRSEKGGMLIWAVALNAPQIYELRLDTISVDKEKGITLGTALDTFARTDKLAVEVQKSFWLVGRRVTFIELISLAIRQNGLEGLYEFARAWQDCIHEIDPFKEVFDSDGVSLGALIEQQVDKENGFADKLIEFYGDKWATYKAQTVKKQSTSASEQIDTFDQLQREVDGTLQAAGKESDDGVKEYLDQMKDKIEEWACLFIFMPHAAQYKQLETLLRWFTCMKESSIKLSKKKYSVQYYLDELGFLYDAKQQKLLKIIADSAERTKLLRSASSLPLIKSHSLESPSQRNGVYDDRTDVSE